MENLPLDSETLWENGGLGDDGLKSNRIRRYDRYHTRNVWRWCPSHELVLGVRDVRLQVMTQTRLRHEGQLLVTSSRWPRLEKIRCVLRRVRSKPNFRRTPKMSWEEPDTPLDPTKGRTRRMSPGPRVESDYWEGRKRLREGKRKDPQRG